MPEVDRKVEVVLSEEELAELLKDLPQIVSHLGQSSQDNAGKGEMP